MDVDVDADVGEKDYQHDQQSPEAAEGKESRIYNLA